MTTLPPDAIQRHQQLCDEIHQHVLAENRFLRQHQRTPDNALLTRKRRLLESLEESLQALRRLPAGAPREAAEQARLEAARDRILQIIQLEKENEQLLLRYSLSRTQHVDTPAPAGAAAMLQRIYRRTN